jgi:hypothetical protein
VTPMSAAVHAKCGELLSWRMRCIAVGVVLGSRAGELPRRSKS